MSLLFRLAVAFVMAAAPAAARAQTPSSRLDAILARGTLLVGLTGDYAPFSLRDKDSGAIEGLDVDMANSLAHALGVRLEIVPTVWANLLSDVAAEKFDVGMGGISVTLDRQKTALFSIPVMRAGKAALARCADTAKYETLADIDKPGTRVVTNPGGTNERFDRANLHQAEIVLYPDNATITGELIAGRADVMLTDSVETRLQQKRHPELCAIHPDKPFDFSELAYLLPRDMVLKAYVDQWLHISFESGEYKRLAAKYLE